jgi:predicted unusual protein kinase regulating ubiquinone biosynthesis (AarF/ABC1/UbiB family)
MGRSGLTHFGPVAARQLRQARQGLLPQVELARPLRLTYEDLGGTFLKLGQLIASSPGMFGDEIADEFRSTLDTGPSVPFAQVRSRVEDDLGMDLDEAFTDFDPVPIGRASIAVVHRARLRNGRRVAVKVIRPGVERSVAVDLELMVPFFEVLARQTGEQLAGSMLQLVEGFRQQVGEELDLRNEARAIAHFRRLLEEIGLPRIVIPETYPNFSGPNVLTMAMLDGVPIDDLARVGDLGVDPGPLVEDVVRFFFHTTARWGTFHGDVHAGNMMILTDGRVGIVDWGIVGRLDPETHWFFLRTMAAVLGEEDAWIDVTRHLVRTYGPALEQAVGMDETELAGFVRSLVLPMLTQPFGQTSLAALFQTFERQVARAHGLEAQQLTLGAVIRRWRQLRQIRQLAEAGGGFDTDFDRGNFLLGKQLMYFERYGRLFLSDKPIMGDREFFAKLLQTVADEGGPPAPAGV